MPVIEFSEDGKDHVILVGDSIFDSFFWNGVGAGTVGQWLLAILNCDNALLQERYRVFINDTAVEPAVEGIVQALLNGDRVSLIHIYDELNVQAESVAEGMVNTFPPPVGRAGNGEFQTTKEDILKALLEAGGNGERVIVDDRSVEETRASQITSAISVDGDGMRNVPDDGLWSNNYIGRREEYGIAYDAASPQSARLRPFCHVTPDPEHPSVSTMQVDIRSNVAGSYVFVSAGGNDLLMDGTAPYATIQNLRVIGERYQELGAQGVIYVIPYTMGGKKDAGFWYSLLSCGVNILRFAAKVLFLNGLVPEYYDAVIDLSDFDDRQRLAQFSIPEPTPLGALEIAWRIAGVYRELSRTDQAEGATAQAGVSTASSVYFFSGDASSDSEEGFNDTDIPNGGASNDDSINPFLPDDGRWPGSFAPR